MKKTLILLIALLLIVSGCGNKEEKTSDEESTKVKEVSKEETENKEEQEENKEEQEEETKKEDTSKNNATSTNTNTKKENTTSVDTSNKEQSVSTEQTKKEESISTTPTLGANEYYSVKTGKVHKYTFTYPDEATCVKKGDGEPYDVVYPIKPYVVFGCEQVKDANGNILWGEYFYSSTDESSIFYW